MTGARSYCATTTDRDIKGARGCSYFHDIPRVSLSIGPAGRATWKITNLEICPSPETRGFSTIRRGKFRNPSTQPAPFCIYRLSTRKRADGRAGGRSRAVCVCTTQHFIFILPASSNELVSSRGPTDLCKRPFLARACAPPVS